MLMIWQSGIRPLSLLPSFSRSPIAGVPLAAHQPMPCIRAYFPPAPPHLLWRPGVPASQTPHRPMVHSFSQPIIDAVCYCTQTYHHNKYAKLYFCRMTVSLKTLLLTFTSCGGSYPCSCCGCYLVMARKLER